MTDQIQIKDLLLRTIIGINDEERRNRQDVVINIVLYADTRAAGVSDNVDQAVNYRTVTKRIIKLVEESRFHLSCATSTSTACVSITCCHFWDECTWRTFRKAKWLRGSICAVQCAA